jgi:hypothetical protein
MRQLTMGDKRMMRLRMCLHFVLVLVFSPTRDVAHAFAPSTHTHSGECYRRHTCTRTNSSPLHMNTRSEPYSDQQPLLARAYSRALRAAIRCGTLFGQIDGLNIDCKASSNLDAALGRISSLQINFDRLVSPFLTTRDFSLVGDDLELGLGPLLLLTTPLLTILLLTSSSWRRNMLPLLLGGLFLRSISKGQQDEDKKNLSMARYRLGITGEDISQPNSLLRMALSRAMDHLLRNSLVGVLAESAMAVQKVQANSSNTRASALVPATPEEQTAKLTAALNESATQLKLNRVTIGDNGRLLLDAVASFPDPNQATTSTSSTNGASTFSQLDFVVRLTLSPLDEDLIQREPTTTGTTTSNEPPRPNGCGIMVSNAELKATFNRDTMGSSIIELFGKPIPDLWIPVVSGGMALPFGRQHRVVAVESISSQDRLDLCGEIYFTGQAPVLKKKNAFGLLKNMLGRSSLPSPPPPPPPQKRPALPPSH